LIITSAIHDEIFGFSLSWCSL